MSGLALGVALGGLLAGCASPETVDDACKDTVSGDQHATTDGPEAVRRMNCYRTLSGLRRLVVDDDLQAAAEGHLRWMITNNRVTSVQEEGTDDFTGTTPLARIEATDYPMDLADYGYWYGDLTASSDDQLELIDHWMASPYSRQFVLQPDQRHMGVALREGLVASLGTYDNPPIEHSTRPVVYPVDGQREVPPDYPWLGAHTEDGVPRSQPLGYPITVTVGSAAYERHGRSPDPYDLVVGGAVLTGPAGDVALHALTHDLTPFDLTYTAAFFPLEPLEADASYRFTATVSWLSDENETSERDVDVGWKTDSRPQD